MRKTIVLLLALFGAVSLPVSAAHKGNRLNVAKRAKEIRIDRKFVVFVPSYNNEQFCEKNLRSIFGQTYDNYRVVYVNDVSTDRTGEMVAKLVEDAGLQDKVTIVTNKVNQKNLHNLYDCAHGCSDDEIIVNLDGDDFFAHKDVLKHLNEYYQSDDVWMTWGSYQHWKSGVRGEHAKAVSRYSLKYKTIRKLPYCYSHLKTFYAALFKRVKKEHLMYKGKFIQLAPDLPTMYPILEMSRTHAYYIPEVLYIYNDSNPISEHHVVRQQDYLDVAEYVRNLPAYPSIKKRDW